jgi:hypothetical protein
MLGPSSAARLRYRGRRLVAELLQTGRQELGEDWTAKSLGIAQFQGYYSGSRIYLLVYHSLGYSRRGCKVSSLGCLRAF